MANTQLLKTQVENHVRAALKNEYGITFQSEFLTLLPGGKHEFDAVSEDKTVVATIKSSSGRTRGGLIPAGKIHAVEAEFYYLMLVNAPIRIVVLTDPEFYGIMDRKLKRKLAPGLHLKLIELPEDLRAAVQKVQEEASLEVSPAAEEY